MQDTGPLSVSMTYLLNFQLYVESLNKLCVYSY